MRYAKPRVPAEALAAAERADLDLRAALMESIRRRRAVAEVEARAATPVGRAGTGCDRSS
ncbi:MAG: hypothetical protein R2719_13310 [Micropruina sp.]